MANKFYIGIKNEVSTGTLELYFTDYIFDGIDWSTWDLINMVQDTIDKIKAANPTNIKLVINSLGGDVMIGLALYNYLKSYKATVEVEVIGFAASIASIMAMCADPGKLKMAKSSFQIIHAAWNYASGNASDLRKSADELDKVTNELAGIYADRSGKTAKYFTDMWKDGDVWLTAAECKEMGLCDSIEDVEPVYAKIDLAGYNFKHVPAGVQAALKADNTGDTHTNFLSTIKAEFMKIKDSLIAAVTGGKEDPKNKDIPNRDAILDMVQNVLAPFAEKIDEALDGAKPAETTTTETKVAETKPATEKKEEKPEEKPEEKKPEETVVTESEDIKALKAEIKALRDSVAFNASKPKPDVSDKANASLNKVVVEYET